MIKIKLLLSLTLFGIITSSLWAQKQYNEQENYIKANSVWVFGNYSGLDFNSGSPKAIITGASSPEGSAAACDPTTGSLLFYVAEGGALALNRNHQVMPNGDSLGGDWNVNQTCIVPVIDSPGIYYVFALSIYPLTTSQGLAYLKYSIVDMSLDNGLGDVRPGCKAIQLLSGTPALSEAVVAIPGNNCGDIWLVVQREREFVSFNITQKGIDTNYIVSKVNSTTDPALNFRFAYASMYVSPNRERIFSTLFTSNGGRVSTLSLLSKFDPNSGRVYDDIIIPSTNTSFLKDPRHPAAFSPDNTKLYIAEQIPELQQFDISIHDSATINASKTVISPNSAPNSLTPRYLRLYRDTIYISYNASSKSYIATINHPNLAGIACNFVDSGVDLKIPGGKLTNLTTRGIGNEIVYPLQGQETRSLKLDTLICTDAFSLDLTTSPGYNHYTWNDSAMGSQRTINTPGIYWVKGEIMEEGGARRCDNNIDTFIIRGGNFPPPIITVNVFELSTTAAYDMYQWYFDGVKIQGATQRILKVSKNGNYTVEVSSKEGCAAVSDIYKVTNTGIPGSPNPESYLSVYPNPTQDVLYLNSSIKLNVTLCSIEGKVLLEVKDASMIPMKSLAGGMYLLRISDQDGQVRQSIKVIKY